MQQFLQFIILTFIYSSTCFGRPYAHHQELNNCSSSLWFYRWSVVIAMLLVVVGPARPRPTGRTAHPTLSWPTALEGSEGSASRPGRSSPSGKTRYPLYRRLGGPQGRSGQVRKISPPLGFDPRAVQPVASRYTYWATRPTGCSSSF